MMGKSLSMDLRARALSAVDGGMNPPGARWERSSEPLNRQSQSMKSGTGRSSGMAQYNSGASLRAKQIVSDRLRMGLQISAFVIHDVHVDTTDARPHGRDRAEDEALSDRSHRCRVVADRTFAAPLFQAWTQAVG